MTTSSYLQKAHFEAFTYSLEGVALQTLGGHHECLLSPAGGRGCILCCWRRARGQRSLQHQNHELTNLGLVFPTASPAGFSVLSRAAPNTLKHSRTWQRTFKQTTASKQRSVRVPDWLTWGRRGPRTERGGRGLAADSRPQGSDSRSPSSSSSSRTTRQPRCPGSLSRYRLVVTRCWFCSHGGLNLGLQSAHT